MQQNVLKAGTPLSFDEYDLGIDTEGSDEENGVEESD